MVIYRCEVVRRMKIGENGLKNLEPGIIISVTKSPKTNVEAAWPLLMDAMESFGIASPLVQVGMAATIAMESHTFLPVQEKHSRDADSALWRAQERYWPSGYYGRGYIQLTWADNYREAADALDVDLYGKPDLAMEPGVAAGIAAWFFRTRSVGGGDSRRIFKACEDGDWRAVRRGINGPNFASDLAVLNRYLKWCMDLQGAIWEA